MRVTKREHGPMDRLIAWIGDEGQGWDARINCHGDYFVGWLSVTPTRDGGVTVHVVSRRSKRGARRLVSESLLTGQSTCRLEVKNPGSRRRGGRYRDALAMVDRERPITRAERLGSEE